MVGAQDRSRRILQRPARPYTKPPWRGIGVSWRPHRRPPRLTVCTERHAHEAAVRDRRLCGPRSAGQCSPRQAVNANDRIVSRRHSANRRKVCFIGSPIEGGSSWGGFREEAPAIIESAAVPAPAINKLAVASIVLSGLGVVGIFAGVPLIGSLLGVVFGHISIRQITRSNGTQKGRGMARTGLVIGYGVPVVLIAIILALLMSGSFAWFESAPAHHFELRSG